MLNFFWSLLIRPVPVWVFAIVLVTLWAWRLRSNARQLVLVGKGIERFELLDLPEHKDELNDNLSEFNSELDHKLSKLEQ